MGSASAERGESRVGIPGEPHQISQPCPSAREGEKHRGDVGLAIRREGLRGEGGQGLPGRIADHPKRRERQTVPAGEGGGHMGFHVDGGGPRGGAQLGLSFDREDRRVDTGQIRRDDAKAEPRQGVEQRGRYVEIGGPPPLLPDHTGADHDVAGLEGRIQSACNSKAHHGPAAGGHTRVEQLAQTVRVTPGPDRLDTGTSRHAALTGKAGHGQDGGFRIDHDPLVDQSRKLRKKARAPRDGGGSIRRGAGLARSRGITV